MEATECSAECQALKDAVVGMDPDELEMELEASGRFSDPRAVAEYLLGGDTVAGADEEEALEPEEPPIDEEPA